MQTKRKMFRLIRIKTSNTNVLINILLCFIVLTCTKDRVPEVESSEISELTANSVVSGGTVTSEGSGAVISRGICWSTQSIPTISDNKKSEGSGTGSFISTITGLNAATTYYLRAYATNSSGTGYGEVITFSTPGQSPAVSTNEVTNLEFISATLNGSVNANYLSTVVTFEYGTSTIYDNSIDATQTPVNGNAYIETSADITGLTEGTTYHYRIKASNSLGTTYGEDMSFTTFGKVTDIEGTIYKTCVIGSQIWMAENLKTTKYNNGTAIPLVSDGTWGSLLTGAYCDYENTASNSDTYGRLYNWYAVNTGNLCPYGWHVPDDNEWTALSTYLGGENEAGGKLKETGIIHWASPNAGATNMTHFTALPGGVRFGDGPFYQLGNRGYWWSSSITTTMAWYRYLSNYDKVMYRYESVRSAGNSVRCIKDN